MLIDFHTHAFPDAVAGRALAHLSQAGGTCAPAPTAPWRG